MAAATNRTCWLPRSIAIVAVIAAFVAFTVPAAAADNDVRLTIRPAGESSTAYFKIDARPGETVQLAVELGNAGQSAMKATTFAAAAFTMPNGGFGVRDLDADHTGTTEWVDYETDTFDITPGASIVREFDLTVPAGTEPGDYVTSLVIQNAEATGSGDGVSLKHIVRQFVAISINVDGARSPSMAIDGVSHDVVGGRSVVVFDVANTGNKHLQPTGALVLRDAQGSQVASSELSMAQFYAATETTFSVTLDTLLAPGDYLASLTLTDQRTATNATFENGLVTVPIIEVPQSVNGDGSVVTPASTNAPVTVSDSPSTMMIIAIGVGCLISGVAITILVMRKRTGRMGPRPAAITISNDPR